MNLIESSNSFSIPRDVLNEGGYQRVEVDPNTENPIRSFLNKEVFGQPDAVDAITSAIMRSETGFVSPNRPKGVFFFLGPTGVGKTEMSKALTRYLYPNDWIDHFKRIDCTDFQNEGSVNRLKGSANGYIGSGDPVLIMPEFLDRGGVIVFDEVEKANRALHNWLLPVMEEGNVTVNLPTDNPAASGTTHGKEIVPTPLDFTKTYLVMTSNVGADAISETRKGKSRVGFGSTNDKTGEIKQAAIRALKEHFAGIPEFLGRIGDANSVVFKDLGIEEYDRILDKFLAELNYSQTRDAILLTATEELRKSFIESAMNGDYGARTLRDLIDREILGKAAELKYMKKVNSGMLIADIDDRTKEVTFWSMTNAAPSQGHSVVIHEPGHINHLEESNGMISFDR